MADSGRWFKLWASALTDIALDNLDIADFGRWCKFGVILKEHGEQGKITLTPPCRSIVSKMQISDFNTLISVIQNFPNCTVSETVSSNGIDGVSYEVKWKNWYKYQGDFSTNRVKKHRKKQLFQNAQNVTTKKRREERRREENIKRHIFTPPLIEEVTTYCQERNNDVDPQKWFSFYEAKGWMIGKNKMKDWKAAVRTWEQSTANAPLDKSKLPYNDPRKYEK